MTNFLNKEFVTSQPCANMVYLTVTEVKKCFIFDPSRMCYTEVEAFYLLKSSFNVFKLVLIPTMHFFLISVLFKA